MLGRSVLASSFQAEARAFFGKYVKGAAMEQRNLVKSASLLFVVATISACGGGTNAMELASADSLPVMAVDSPSVVCGVPQVQIDAAAAGAVVDMTGCSYSGTLLINKPLTLKGLTVQSPTGRAAITVTASDVTLERVMLQGPQANNYEPGAQGIGAVGSPSAPLHRFKVLDSVISRYGYGGIVMDFVYDAQILRNRIADVVYAGIMITSARGGLVQGNTVGRIGVYGAGANSNNAYGIAISSNDPSVNPQSTDVVVDGNLVEDVPTWHGLDSHAGIRIKFTNNIVRRARDGIYVTGDGAGRRSQDVVTSGNRIEAPAGADQYGITYVFSAGGQVTNNNIIGYPSGHALLTTSSGSTAGTAVNLIVSRTSSDPLAPLPVSPP
jgi:hypothetical protein